MSIGPSIQDQKAQREQRRGMVDESTIEALRSDFPLLSREVHGKPLAYLDNAATTQKPQQVLDAITTYYRTSNANVHRGVHRLSQEATAAYEDARTNIARWLNAERPQEFIFTRGTTEAINLIAQSWGRANLTPGDEIVISHMEHHSNIVPWQLLCEQTGAVLRVCPINDRGEIIMEEMEGMIGDRTRIVSIVHLSNTLGTLNPVKAITSLAHKHNAIVVVDGAQATQHMNVDVREIGCDFYAISGHKMFGPTGIGGMYGRFELLDAMPPWQGGGEMIKSVSFEKTVYNDVPGRFEAGTPNIAGAIGLGAAVDYLHKLDLPAVAAHEQQLLETATERLREIDGIRLIGTAREKAGALSFVMDGVHPHDAGTILDAAGVAVRTGHHCTQPLMDRFGVPATIRASFSFYNTSADVDALINGLQQVREVFGS